MPTRHDPRVLGFYTAFAVVVASMIGTGVFTTLGFQVVAIHDGLALLALWLLGGVIALCGAVSYAELAAALPRSGGEYHFLGRIYHPVLGELAGLVSVVVGFAAPVALAAMAFGQYAGTLLPVPPTHLAIAAIALVSAFHGIDVRAGQGFQVVTTGLKIAVIALFCTAGLLAPTQGDVTFGPPARTLDDIFSPAFAVGLIYVYYAYSGWNAAAYFLGEIHRPERIVPRAMFWGTVLVTLLYLLLNHVFLKAVPLAELAGRVEIGALAANAIFEARGSIVVSAMLSLLLLSTISAMTLAGPRVLTVLGEDVLAARALAKRTRGGAPLRAILVQQGLATVFVLTGSFEAVLSFAGFTLTLFALLTVLGVIILRRREPALPRPYRTWGYPLTPAFFVLVNAVVLVFVLRERPLEATASLAVVAMGLALGLARRRRGNARAG
jgi:APA family basic amino acid/polyamine antiporter